MGRTMIWAKDLRDNKSLGSGKGSELYDFIKERSNDDEEYSNVTNQIDQLEDNETRIVGNFEIYRWDML